MFVLFSLGITVLALRLGRQLAPAQDQPSAGVEPGAWPRAGRRPRQPVRAAPDGAHDGVERLSARDRGAPSSGCRDRPGRRSCGGPRGRANSHQTALPPPGVRREPQAEAMVATMEMPRPASSAGSARRRRGRWSSPSVTSTISRRSVRRSRSRIGGVPCWRELATSSLAARTPRSCSSAGKRQLARTPEAKARARGAASTPPSSSSAALRKSSASGPVRAGCWRTRTATSSSCSAVTPSGAQQAVADDLGGAGGAGEGALQGGDALVDVLVAALDQAVGVEDGGGAGAERDGARGVHPAAGAQRGAGGLVGAADGAVRRRGRGSGRWPAEA